MSMSLMWNGIGSGAEPEKRKNQIPKATSAMPALITSTPSSTTPPSASSPRASRSSTCVRFSHSSMRTITRMLTTAPTIITPIAAPSDPVEPCTWEPI